MAEDSDGDIMVFSHIIRPSGPPVRFDWRVRANGEGYKIVDVMVEGISMVITQRAVFNSVIRESGGNFDGLLVALRQQTLVTLAADHYSNLNRSSR
jgi:phospholipid transport system substrate-binding protein